MSNNQIALKHFLSVENLDETQVMALIERAAHFKSNAGTPEINHDEKYRHTYVANLFFESSTRTHKSFEVAEMRLGMSKVGFDPGYSSITKGETLYDTVLTLEAIGADIAVIRSGEREYYKELLASPSSNISIINAGDGSGQHPSQCLLDMMTIYEEFGSFRGLKVAIVGDLSHSRVAHSNMQLLHRLGADLYFSGPEIWYETENDVYGQYRPLDEVVEIVDVVMLLRVQRERHVGEEVLAMSKEAYLNAYGLTVERANRMQPQAIIMHPAPVNRGVEIDSALVESAQSRILNQMTNGVYCRMAILEAIWNGRREGVES